jgi:hypothetical protein
MTPLTLASTKLVVQTIVNNTRLGLDTPTHLSFVLLSYCDGGDRRNFYSSYCYDGDRRDFYSPYCHDGDRRDFLFFLLS